MKVTHEVHQLPATNEKSFCMERNCGTKYPELLTLPFASYCTRLTYLRDYLTSLWEDRKKRGIL